MHTQLKVNGLLHQLISPLFFDTNRAPYSLATFMLPKSLTYLLSLLIVFQTALRGASYRAVQLVGACSSRLTPPVAARESNPGISLFEQPTTEV